MQGALPGPGGHSSPVSLPAYPHKRSGTCLVCGFAPTVFEDLREALRLRPQAQIIAVNQAATEIDAFAIFSLHHKPDKLGKWAEIQKRKFGRCEVHAHGSTDRPAEKRAAYPYVDYWWPDARGTGTSAWAAQKLAKLMGFEERILCGVVLERAPYANNTFCRDFRDPRVLKIYRDYIRDDTEWHDGVTAMSGWPRKFFGAPE